MINGFTVLNNLLNIKLKGNLLVEDHTAYLESQISRIAAINSGIEKQINIAILLSSLNKKQRSVPTTASMHNF